MTNVSNIPRKAVLARLSLAEYARQVHFYVALAGDTLEDMSRPGYFDGLAPRLRRYDKLEVVSDSDNVFAEFLVIESSSAGVRVLPWKGGEFNNATQAGSPGAALRREADLRVEYRGPFLLWCVVRGDRIQKDKFAVEADAIRYMNELARTTSRTGPEAA